MTVIKNSFIKPLLLGAACAIGLAAAYPTEARTYVYASVSSDPYYSDRYGYRIAYERPYYRHRHYYYPRSYAYDPYYSSRYRCYREWDGERVCYRRY